MSIVSLIKKARKYMAAIGPVRLGFNFRRPPVVSVDAPIHREEFHRYGPEDRPEPQPPIVPPSAIRPDRHEPLALCRKCKTYRPMKWKPPGERGKDVKTWFVCAKCGCDKLELQMVSYAEAVRRNQPDGDDGEAPF